MITIEWPFVALLLALFFAFLGQLLFSDRRFYNLALFSYAIAVVAMFAYAWLERRRPQSHFRLHWRGALLALLAMLALVACLMLEIQDRAYLIQIALWVVSMFLLIWVFAPSRLDWRAWLASLRDRARRNWPEITLIGIILVAGFFLRAYNLEQIPAGVHGDEGEFGTFAVRILQGENQRIGPFYTGGSFLHPNGFHYLQALSMWLWGTTIGGLRMISAVIGALTLLPVFLLSRRLFGRWVALIATFWLAVSPWHIQFSRLAWNEIPVPLMGVLCLYFLYRGVESERPLDFCLSGLFLGIGIQIGSKSAWYTGVIVGALVVYLLVVRRGFLRQHYKSIVVLAVGFAVALAPLALHYTRFGWKQLVFQPVSNKSLMQNIERAYSNYNTRSLLQVLRIQAEKAFLVFNYYGDAGFFSFTQEPVIDPLAASLYVLGLAYSVYHWKTFKYALMVVWLGVSLSGNVLSIDPPQALRLTGATPVPYIFAAITADLVHHELGALRILLNGRWRMLALTAGLVLLLAVVGYISLNTYFVRYAARWPYRNVTEVAREIKRLGADYDVVLVSDLPFGHGTIRFIALGVKGREARSFQDILDIPDDSPRDVAFIVTSSHYQLLPFITQQYPGGVSKQDEQYVSYIVSRERIRERAAAIAAEDAGLVGRYYLNADWAGTPAVQRSDPLIAFRDFRLPADRPFTAQWEGALEISQPGSYQLRLLANGEVWLYLDGHLIINGQEPREAWFKSEKQELDAGRHDLRLRYRYARGWQLLELHWETPDGQDALVPSEVLRK